jgi:Xaa-Pro aminopeptidase
MEIFSEKTYIERRKRLKQQLGTGVAIFLGNDESSINFKDNWYPFRQDSSFLYFFGLDMPGLVAVIDIDKDQEILFGDDISTVDSIWQGPQPGLAELAGSVGVQIVWAKREISLYLAKFSQEHLHYLPPYRPENIHKLSEWLTIGPKEVELNVSERFIKAIVNLRSIKSQEEIAEISKAVNLSVCMHRGAMKAAKEGMKEFEVLGMVIGEALSAGGSLSFPPIITINGQILHNHHYGNTLRKGKMLLCDFGAETAMHYAGDITRTFPVGPEFSETQREVYQIVRDAHQAAVRVLRPGIEFRDVHLLACKKLTEGLIALGLMKGDAEEAVRVGAHALFFQCGLGHMMGLDVHDMEDLGEQFVGYTPTLKKNTQFGLKSLRLGRALERGFVITVEPGLYFIPQLIEQWQSEKLHKDFINYDRVEQFKNFGGIRIEDGFEITEKGAQLVGDYLETEISEIEAVKRGK